MDCADSASSEPWLARRYRLGQALHASAFSVIRRGWDRLDDVEVVVKCFDTVHRAQYRREIAAGFGLQHPRLVHCRDTFHLADGRPCIVYDYLREGTVRDLLRRCGTLEPNELCTLLDDMLAALMFLHDNDRIHCDIKPENLFVRRQDGIRRFLLGDPGATCSMREARAGLKIPATPAYIAPERIYDRFRCNSDLYSLGIVAFEACCGHRPFDGDMRALYRAHLREMPDLDALPVALRAFIGQLLEKDPDQRLPDATTARYLLSRLRDGVTTVPPVPHTASLSPAKTAAPTRVVATAVDSDRQDRRYRPQRELTLHYLPQQLYWLSDRSTPVLAAATRDFFELFDFGQPLANRFFSARLLGAAEDSAELLYAAERRLYGYAVAERRAQPIDALPSSEVLYGMLERRYAAWCTDRHWYWQDREHGRTRSFAYSSYLRQPLGQLRADGSLFTTDGLFHQHIVHRVLSDGSADVVRVWRLDGPVLALTVDGQHILALTLDADTHRGCSLWMLDIEQGRGSRRSLDVPLPGHCFTTPGRLYWLKPSANAGSELMHVGQGAPIGTLLKSRHTLLIAAVSTDRHHVATADTLTASSARLTLWNLETDVRHASLV